MILTYQTAVLVTSQYAKNASNNELYNQQRLVSVHKDLNKKKISLNTKTENAKLLKTLYITNNDDD